eukprot:TRINITY_DN18653_c0_g1_i1.p1 TRINITY_DN18653_c0_g1~~TRINITY_DN18653_c0_g1_i1.p1  ORF type:complete len:401 (-),score=14.74 TRINITY_DN18653_c0_g1_i1:357-1559(-)
MGNELGVEQDYRSPRDARSSRRSHHSSRGDRSKLKRSTGRREKKVISPSKLSTIKSDTGSRVQTPNRHSQRQILSYAILCEIFGYFDIQSLFTCSLVCKDWYKTLQSERVWRELTLRKIYVPQLWDKMRHENHQLCRTRGHDGRLRRCRRWKELFFSYYHQQNLDTRKKMVCVRYNYGPFKSKEILEIRRGNLTDINVKDCDKQTVNANDVWCLVTKPGGSLHWIPSGYLDSHLKIVKSRPKDAEIESIRASAIPRQPIPSGRNSVLGKMDYIAGNDQELSFKKFDFMTVVKYPSRTPENRFYREGRWLYVQHTQGAKQGRVLSQTGWIPDCYVDRNVRYAVSIFRYVSAANSELSLNVGQKVVVLMSDTTTGFWLVQKAGKRGHVPENCLAPLGFWNNL